MHLPRSHLAMFSSPNVTGGFGTLGAPNPQQSTLGLPNPTPAMSMQTNSGMPNAYAPTSGIILPALGSTSSPGFTFNANTPASLPGQLPLSLAGTYGTNNASNTPNMTGGMLGIPPGTGFTRGAGTPGAQSVSGQSQGQARKQASADEGGLSIDAALKGLEEAMAAVVKMEELLMGIKADEERVFGGKGALSSNLSGSEAMAKAEGMGAVRQAGDAGLEQGDAGMGGSVAGSGLDHVDGSLASNAVGGMQDTAVLQRLQQSRLECRCSTISLPSQIDTCGPLKYMSREG